MKYYIVGVFDCFHHGHMTFIQKCIDIVKKNNGVLYVGVHTDEFVLSYKRKTIQDQQTRLIQVQKHCYNYDCVVDTFLIDGNHEVVFEKYNVSHIIHGDDWTKEK